MIFPTSLVCLTISSCHNTVSMNCPDSRSYSPAVMTENTSLLLSSNHTHHDNVIFHKKYMNPPNKNFITKIIDIGMSKEVKSNGTMHIGISCVGMKGVGISCVEHIKTILPSLYPLLSNYTLYVIID